MKKIFVVIILVQCLAVSANTTTSPAEEQHYLSRNGLAMAFPGIRIVLQINNLANQTVLLGINHQANKSLFIQGDPYYTYVLVPQQGDLFTVFLYLNNTLLDSLTIPIIQNGGIPTTFALTMGIITFSLIFLLLVVVKIGMFLKHVWNVFKEKN